jgi:hypothetical protein
MFVPFESTPSNARVWIFQSNRPFSAEELKSAERKLRAFTDVWAVHGEPLNASFKIAFNQFIILAADETHHDASGCSIDSSVRELKELEQDLGVDLFDRNLVAFKSGDGISLVPVMELKEKFSNGTLNGGTFTFNNLVGTKSGLEKDWIVPAGSTWLKRYIPIELEKASGVL